MINQIGHRRKATVSASANRDPGPWHHTRSWSMIKVFCTTFWSRWNTVKNCFWPTF